MSEGGDPDLLWPESEPTRFCPTWEFLEYGTAHVPAPRIPTGFLVLREEELFIKSIYTVQLVYFQ